MSCFSDMCPLGQYEDLAMCLPCPENTFSNVDIYSVTECQPCSPGETTNGLTGQTSCTGVY